MLRAMPLLETTQKLLNQAVTGGMSLREIAKASDGAIGREWLTKFSAGSIPDPSVNRIQTLHDCLKKLISKNS